MTACQNVTYEFDNLGRSDNFRFIGNVEIGKDLPLSSLKNAYDSIIFAYGASKSRKLNIPGEDTTSDIFTAQSFVNWYNGYPGAEETPINLEDVEEVAIIGNGNVALDCARILLAPTKNFRNTDIPPHVLDHLRKSNVRFVRIIGRRSFAQSSFTASEFRALFALENACFMRDAFFSLQVAPAEGLAGSRDLRLERRMKRLSEVWNKQVKSTRHKNNYPDLPVNIRSGFTFNWVQSPTQFIADKQGRLAEIELRRNKMVPHPYYPESVAEPKEPEELSRVAAHMCIEATGYVAEPLPGFEEMNIDFDARANKITNFDGRVQDKQGNAIPGLFCSGWIRTGPVGVIAETLRTSYETAMSLVNDIYTKGVKGLGGEGGWDVLKKEVEAKGVRWTSWEDWVKVREYERFDPVKPFKVTSKKEMFEIMDGKKRDWHE